MQILSVVFACAICVAIGGLALGVTFVAARRLYRFWFWPDVMGRVVHLQPASFDSEYDEYTARVEYQYELFGTSHSGSVDRSWRKSPVGAEYLTRPYRVGNQVRIVYNPNQPAQSIIADDIQDSISALLGILFGMGMLGFLAYMIWRTLSNPIAWPSQ